MKIIAIVEGYGEVKALPILLRRLGEWSASAASTDVLSPIRVKRDRFLRRAEEFTRYLELAARKCGPAGWILILLDADDDCPAVLAPDLLARAARYLPEHRLSVVLANREYEAWFIAAAQSLQGRRGFGLVPGHPVDAETPRDAKGWIRARMAGGSYGETTDQPAFSAVMDLQQAYEGSRSFRKLCDEWRRHVAGE